MAARMALQNAATRRAKVRTENRFSKKFPKKRAGGFLKSLRKSRSKKSIPKLPKSSARNTVWATRPTKVLNLGTTKSMLRRGRKIYECKRVRDITAGRNRYADSSHTARELLSNF